MFNDLSDESATLVIMWENLMVPVKLKVDTDAQVMKGIEAAMAGPAANDYFAAASYYYGHDKDMKKALEWINKSIDLGGDRFWVVTMKARIQQKLGDFTSGIATAEKALKLAQEVKNNDYIKINQELIAAMKQ
jgi:tetratricopeptide (TPR) repeat protein